MERKTWQGTMEAFDQLVEQVAINISKDEGITIEEARVMAHYCASEALRRHKEARNVVRRNGAG